MNPLLEVKAGDTFERVFERVLAGVAEPFASGTVIRAQIRRQPGGGTADLLADFAVEILDQTASPGRFVLRVERSVTAACSRTEAFGRTPAPSSRTPAPTRRRSGSSSTRGRA